MKIAFIAPTNLIKDYCGDFNLALSHLIESRGAKNAYTKAIIATGKPIILDNGLFENGKPEAIESLFKKANKIGAKTVFCPDTLFDRKATETAFTKIASNKKRIFKGKLAFVVQADNAKDYVASYKWAVENPDIDLIGLSILAIPKSFRRISGTDDIVTNRIMCLKELARLSKHKASHLLGAGSSYRDIDFAAKFCPWVVSHDSSSAVWNGVYRKAIDPVTLEVEGGKNRLAVDFSWEEVASDQDTIIRNNMRVVRKLAKQHAD